ncbi:MAG: DUF1501 domain-containing protein [Rhodospirillaceae bacterium]|nr:DUF1501 domain-containing protein [Rhodospirillaceae bacterium]
MSRFDRRHFLQLGAAGTALIPFGRNAFAASAPGNKRLVVVLLRGAVDGLNVVVPHAEAAYYEARPTIAIPQPARDGGALDLDGHFGLHPAMAALMPHWRDGTLAFVPASGSPDATRSHFDAQDYMESGTPGQKSTADGWMNRLLTALPVKRTSTTALSFGPTLPRIFAGPSDVATVPLGRAAASPIPLDRPIINAAFDQLYTGEDALSRAYREGLESHKKVMKDLQADMMAADNGAPSPDTFGQDAAHLARLIKQDPSVNLAFFALGGWDTHVNQGGSDGQLAGRLKPLAEGLAGLATGLGKDYQDTAILVMSEFGRTVHENGNRGTDHGHGNVMWVMGGSVAGGKIHGRWPGLESAALYENRDLAVTTDFRSVIASVLAGHMKLTPGQVAGILPGAPTGDIVLVRA